MKSRRYITDIANMMMSRAMLAVTLVVMIFSDAKAETRMDIDTVSADTAVVSTTITTEAIIDSLYNRDVDLYEMPRQETGYDRRVHRIRKHWDSLIPTQTIAQYAGNMGVFSLGVGWEYGKHGQWETNLLFGYLPKFRSDRAKITITLKENFIPWGLYVKGGWLAEPLSCGLYLNTILDGDFWDRQPERYPDNYYPYLSTKVRINVFLGQRMTKIIPHNKRKTIKSITFFYEVSTCDVYLRTMIQDRKVTLWDIIGLSIGIKTQLF